MSDRTESPIIFYFRNNARTSEYFLGARIIPLTERGIACLDVILASYAQRQGLPIKVVLARPSSLDEVLTTHSKVQQVQLPFGAEKVVYVYQADSIRLKLIQTEYSNSARIGFFIGNHWEIVRGVYVRGQFHPNPQRYSQYAKAYQHKERKAYVPPEPLSKSIES